MIPDMTDDVMIPAVMIRFDEDPELWAVDLALKRWVRENGWSIASQDRDKRRGIMFASCVKIAKWHALSQLERAQCDAVAIGSGRHGPIVVVRQSQDGVPQPDWKTRP